MMAGHAGSAVAVVLIIGMACACLYCARELWTDGSLRAWCAVAVMNLGMVAAHFSLPGHQHGAAAPLAVVQPPSALMTVATTVAVAEVVIATAVLWHRTRGRGAQLALGRRELA